MKTSALLARRYACALLDLALAGQGDVFAKIEEDAATLMTLLEDSGDLRFVLASPIITQKNKGAILASVSQKAKLHPLFVQFLRVLNEHGRASLLPAVLAAMITEISLRRGHVIVQVQTAYPLSAKHHKDLIAALTPSGSAAVDLENTVDPNLLGGMIVTIGSMRMDDSLRGKLTRLGAQMEGNKAA